MPTCYIIFFLSLFCREKLTVLAELAPSIQQSDTRLHGTDHFTDNDVANFLNVSPTIEKMNN